MTDTTWAADARIVFPAESWEPLKAGLDWLTGNPYRFYMDAFVVDLTDTSPEQDWGMADATREDLDGLYGKGARPECGTVACAAGGILIAADVIDRRDVPDRSYRWFLEQALTVLHLPLLSEEVLAQLRVAGAGSRSPDDPGYPGDPCDLGTVSLELANIFMDATQIKTYDQMADRLEAEFVFPAPLPRMVTA